MDLKECCKNQKIIYVAVENSIGNYIVREACVKCKKIFGRSFKKTENFNQLPKITYKRHQELKEIEYIKLNEKYKERIEIINKERIEIKKEFQNKHSEYIKTNQWKKLAIKILNRDKFICQGCLENKATEVHHKTYKNLTQEFCFELISLCHNCHSRYHNKNN
jgi:hypothetical protein